MEELQTKNDRGQRGHQITSRTELGVFDDPYASDILAGYSVTSELLKDVPHDCVLNCCLLSGNCIEAFKRLCKTN